MTTRAVSIFAVGDVLLDVDDVETCLSPSREALGGADFVIANCEGVYSDNPSPAPSAKHVMVAPAERARLLHTAPIHLMTCAGNHMVDAGYDGLRQTLGLLHGQGVATCGAGENLAEACRPAVLERNGLKIEVHAFGSVFPVGYEAREKRPGINPLRVLTHYSNPDPNFWEPGIAPKITTTPLPEDHHRMRRLLQESGGSADRTIATFHWGYSSEFVTMRDYELELARGAVDQGADVVLCHHHHSLRGIEFRRGKPIFYGLGTYIHHFSHVDLSPARVAANKAAHGDYFVGPRDDYPLFPFHPEARMTGIVTLDFATEGNDVFGFIPARIEANGTTTPLRAADAGAGDVLDYLESITRSLGFDTRFRRQERDGFAWVEVSPGPIS